jgi:hypothetical protein
MEVMVVRSAVFCKDLTENAAANEHRDNVKRDEKSRLFIALRVSMCQGDVAVLIVYLEIRRRHGIRRRMPPIVLFMVAVDASGVTHQCRTETQAPSA